jgi:hypothetical protein
MSESGQKTWYNSLCIMLSIWPRALTRNIAEFSLYQILLSPSFISLCLSIVFPIILNILWNLPCIPVQITNSTHNEISCCSKPIYMNVTILTMFLIPGLLGTITVLRCGVGEHCYCNRSVQRKYIDVSGLNIIGYMFSMTAWVLYAGENVFYTCNKWDIIMIRIGFIWLLSLGLFLLVVDEICIKYICL